MLKSTPTTAAGLAADAYSSPAQLDRNASSDGRSLRTRPLLRKYEIAHLTSSHDIHETTRLAPATPVFGHAFAALGRGAMVQTATGPVAVEDLLPGDQILTADGRAVTLMWHGSMVIVPGTRNERAEMGTMTRMTAEALGPTRPSPDLVLGPAARMVHRGRGVNRITGSDAALLPVRDFIEQTSIIELTPVAPVHCYQLGFEDHEILRINGVELESLHPGAVHTLKLRPDMKDLFLSLFPHKSTFGDFGPMRLPRLNLRDLDIFDYA